MGLAVGTWSQAEFESKLQPDAPVAMMAAGKQIIPPGACVLADNVAYTVTSNRFVSAVPGCPTIDDGTGANYALSKGRSTPFAGWELSGAPVAAMSAASCTLSTCG